MQILTVEQALAQAAEAFDRAADPMTSDDRNAMVQLGFGWLDYAKTKTAADAMAEMKKAGWQDA